MAAWTTEQLDLMSKVQPSDIARALALIAEASAELSEMVKAEEQEQPE